MIRANKDKNARADEVGLAEHDQGRTPPNGLMSWCRIHNGDARDLLRLVPEDSVDLILTSPPYADLKDYGYEGQIGFGQPFDAYLQDMSRVLEACFKVAKSSASLWLVSDVFKKNGEMVDLPSELARCAQEAKWKLQDIIIWHKTKTLPWSHRGRLRKIFERVYVFSKSKAYKYYPERIRETEGLQEWWIKYPERYNPLGKTPHNIWHFPIPTQGSWGNGMLRHFNPFPASLVERIVELATDPGDVILDPFAGTGTVLAQAQCMDRLAAGVELNPDFTGHLYPKVLANTKELWNRNRIHREQRHGRSDQFDSLIMRMRKVKLGKQVVKVLGRRNRDSEGPHQLITAIVLDRGPFLPSHNDRHKLGMADIFLVAANGCMAAVFENQALEVCSRAPLSKYGVHVTIRGVTVAQLVEDLMASHLDSETPLFVYPASTQHVHRGTIELNEVERFCRGEVTANWTKSGIPPVFSDIEVNEKEILQFTK